MTVIETKGIGRDELGCLQASPFPALWTIGESLLQSIEHYKASLSIPLIGKMTNGPGEVQTLSRNLWQTRCGSNVPVR